MKNVFSQTVALDEREKMVSPVCPACFSDVILGCCTDVYCDNELVLWNFPIAAVRLAKEIDAAGSCKEKGTELSGPRGSH